jgi:hypothetical protein
MWEKLSVRQFIELYDIEKNSNLFLIEKQVKMLSIIEGKDEREYDGIKYGMLLEKLNDKTSFFDNIPETHPVDIIEVNGNKYKFVHEVDQLTAGQFIDISHWGGNLMEIHNAAACFMRSMKGNKILKYGSIPHNKIAEDLLDARFVDIHGCLVFFYLLLTEFTKLTLDSLKLKEENQMMLTNLLRDGVGLAHLN